MADRSSYLQYLPVQYTEHDPPPPAFSLGATLRIFEKVLTGIDDGVELRHDVPDPPDGVGPHVHDPISSVISGLSSLLDPWRTPTRFLPWLASWVALDFPTLQGEDLWDEYQQRKVTSQIAQIYRQRGLKAGLNLYLDLYAAGRLRPRVALDDGSRVLAVTPTTTGHAPVMGLVTEGPVMRGNAVATPGIARPVCAVSGDAGLFVGDLGIPAGNPTPMPSRVWLMGGHGQYVMSGEPPQRSPLSPDTMPLTGVAALALRPGTPGSEETLFALDQSGKLYAVRAPYLGVDAAELGRLSVPGATFAPVAMSVHPDGRLLVLDRADGAGSPHPPTMLSVRTDPFQVTRAPLTGVVEPLSLLVEPDGTVLVGDGGDQEPAGPEQFSGNLWRLERNGGTGWTETALLPPVNQLVAPTGLARTGSGRLYVLDAGLKPFSPIGLTDPFLLPVAEPASIFRMDLQAKPPLATRITEPGQFVHPTHMVAVGDRLLVSDPGHPLQSFRSRIRPFQFDVVVHFMASRLPTDQAERDRACSQAVGDVRSIIEQQQPAHTHYTLVTRF
jgi:phage tail-like protein